VESLPRKRIWGLRSSVGMENEAASHLGLVVAGIDICQRRAKVDPLLLELARQHGVSIQSASASGARQGGARTLCGFVAVDPGLSVVLVSLCGSVVVEGMVVIRGIRGLVPVRTVTAVYSGDVTHAASTFILPVNVTAKPDPGYSADRTTAVQGALQGRSTRGQSMLGQVASSRLRGRDSLRLRVGDQLAVARRKVHTGPGSQLAHSLSAQSGQLNSPDRTSSRSRGAT